MDAANSAAAAGAAPLTDETEAYSLWVLPEGPLALQLQREIDTQAKHHGAPSFPPHVTVLGNICQPLAQVVATTQRLAAQVKKYPLTFLNTARGDFYYRCIYLLCALDTDTARAAALAGQLFDKPTVYPYMPHLSLLYADLPEEQSVVAQQAATQRLYGDAAEYDTLLTTSTFTAGSLALWYTPIADKSLKSWRLVQTFPLAG